MHQKRRIIAPVMIAALFLFALIGAMTRASSQRAKAHTVPVGDLTRTYYLHVPSNLPEDKALPLVLMFHGGGGTPKFAERESGFSELADREGFLVAYPEGIGKSWNDGRNEKAIVAQRDKIDDLGFISALIDDVARDYKVDAKRVFSAGISNGATFSHYLGANLSSRIAAIAPVIGGMPAAWSAAFKPEKPVSVLILQSVHDPLMPYDGGDIKLPMGVKRAGIVATDEAARKWVEHNGCQRKAVTEVLADKDPEDGCRVRTFTYSKGKAGTDVVLYRIEGAGHTWPDGLQYMSEKVIGKVCRDINGAEVIWEFFRRHPKP